MGSPRRLIHKLFVLKILNFRTRKHLFTGAGDSSKQISLTRLEVFDVLIRHLSDFEQTDGALVVDEGTALHGSLGTIHVVT